MNSPKTISRREFISGVTAFTMLPTLNLWSIFNSFLPAKVEGEGTLLRIMEKAKKERWNKLGFGTIVGKVGLELVGTPYVGKTLEAGLSQEKCIVTLSGLDCVTFFETSLAIARMIVFAQSGSANLLRQITYTRYRGGIVNGYPSRLHYTSDWMNDNVKKGAVEYKTLSMPNATRFKKLINFMSQHPQSYEQLKQNPNLVPEILKTEQILNSSKLYYVPKEFVAKGENQLKTGDIIGITTVVAGIDCSHTGLIWVDPKGVRHFLHASLSAQKVVLDVRLSDYLLSIPKHTGIMVVRPIRPAR